MHDRTCTICLREVEVGRHMPCKHIFHDDCLSMWIERHKKKNCPKCGMTYTLTEHRVRSTQQLNMTKKASEREVNETKMGKQITKKFYIIDRKYNGKGMNKLELARLGGTPFGLPTEAVYNRNSSDFQLRMRYTQMLLL